MRVGCFGLAEQRGQLPLHADDLRQSDHETSAVGIAGKRLFFDERVEGALDTDPAVQGIHDQQQIGLVHQILVFDPAVTIVQGFTDAEIQPSADTRGVVLGGAKLAGDLVDLLEAESPDLPNEDIRVFLQNIEAVAAQSFDQSGDLMMGQSECRQPCHDGVDATVLQPFVTQPPGRIQGQPSFERDALGVIQKGFFKGVAETLDDQSGLGRTNALDLRMVGQIVDQPLRVEFEVVLHPVDLELTAVFGMGGPRPEQDHRLIFPGEQIARELDFLTGRGEQSACGKLGSGIVNALYSSPESRRVTLISFWHLAILR